MTWEEVLKMHAARIAEELVPELQNVSGLPTPAIRTAWVSVHVRIETHQETTMLIASPESPVSSEGIIRRLIPEKSRYEVRSDDWKRIDGIKDQLAPHQMRLLGAYRENGNRPISTSDISALLGGRNVQSQRQIINGVFGKNKLPYRIQSPQAGADGMSSLRKSWMIFKHPESRGMRKSPYHIWPVHYEDDTRDDTRKEAGTMK